jgi:hypothetical protein
MDGHLQVPAGRIAFAVLNLPEQTSIIVGTLSATAEIAQNAGRVALVE